MWMHNDSQAVKSQERFWAIFCGEGVVINGSGLRIALRPFERCAQEGLMLNTVISVCYSRKRTLW